MAPRDVKQRELFIYYNRKAVDLSLQLYTEGQVDFLNVLNAQRSLYGSEDALVQSERNIATDLIALYKALGGS
ncbi:MAG: TolC family protein [Syntrophales bacterium]